MIALLRRISMGAAIALMFAGACLCMLGIALYHVNVSGGCL